MNVFELPRADITYLRAILLDESERLRVRPYAELQGIPQEHITQFCLVNGLYCLPTIELVAFIAQEIAGRKTIEIGSGNGALGRALEIPLTDSYQQNDPAIRSIWASAGQAPVQYGMDVLRYAALDAIRRFKPDCVVAAWVTHKYDPQTHYREGNMYGVQEEKIMAKVRKYVFVGNENAHRHKPILELPHRTIKADWLLSRSLAKDQNAIWIWER